MSLVVSPLTSLIEDQVQNLNEHNIKATPIYGNSTPVHMKGTYTYQRSICFKLKWLQIFTSNSWENSFYKILRLSLANNLFIQIYHINHIDIKDGKSVVVLATPEAVLSKQWRSTILEARKYICMVAYDEAHCISEW